MTSQEYCKIAVAALEDRKAEDVKIIDIREISPVADYFVIADGTNQNQIQAMRDACEEALYKAGLKTKQIEGNSSSTWILMDYGDIIVLGQHLGSFKAGNSRSDDDDLLSGEGMLAGNHILSDVDVVSIGAWHRDANRITAGGHDNAVGIELLHERNAGLGVQANLDVLLFELVLHGGDEIRNQLLVRRLAGIIHRSAEPV